eukprot:gene31982-53555_t
MLRSAAAGSAAVLLVAPVADATMRAGTGGATSGPVMANQVDVHQCIQ